MNHPKNDGIKVRDVVCGMFLNLSNASKHAEYAQETYYFCSSMCEKTFAANPPAYAKGERSQQSN